MTFRPLNLPGRAKAVGSNVSPWIMELDPSLMEKYAISSYVKFAIQTSDFVLMAQRI